MKVKVIYHTQDRVSGTYIAAGCVLDNASLIEGGYSGMIDVMYVEVPEEDCAIVVED